MALNSIKFVKKLTIVPTQVVATASSVSALTSGQIAFVDTAGNILNATTIASADVIRIVKMGPNGPSDLGYSLSRAQLEPIVAKDYTAPTMTVSNIGYDGTSGSIDVISDNPFEVAVIDKDSPTYGTTGYTTVGYFKSSSSATQQEIADGLVTSLVGQSQILIAQPFKAELLLSGTRSASGSTSFDFVNKSKIVSITGAASNFVAGDYIAPTTGTSAACYKIASVSTTAIELELPFQGTTQTVAAGNIRVASAAAQAGNFGIQLTGLPQPFASDDTAAAQEFYVARFLVALVGFTNTIATTVVGNKGSGAAPEIAVEERALVGEKGFLYTATWPPAQFPNETNINAVGYGVITINCTNPSGPLFLQGANPANRIQLVIACEKASATAGNAGYNTVVTDNTRGILNLLSVWSGQTVTF